MRSLHCLTRPRAAAWVLLALAVLAGHGLLLRALLPSVGLPVLQVAQKPARSPRRRCGCAR